MRRIQKTKRMQSMHNCNENKTATKGKIAKIAKDASNAKRNKDAKIA